MESPLVTVICLSHNHERFVREAINSVFNQTYNNLQVIIVDDGSKDASVTIIEEIMSSKPEITFLKNETAQGNCKAFNHALKLAKGKYIIDFATDDVMLPYKIQEQVIFFEKLDSSYGVVFTDAIYIGPDGKPFRNHFEYLFGKKLLTKIPQGDVYADVLSTYFIPSPTMMVRKEVFDFLNGYDEALSYEDFDFWVRASRKFKFAFLDTKSTKIRRNTTSMSSGWYKQGDKQLHSTYLVCEKAFQMNQTSAENEALVIRLQFEIRQSVFSENPEEAKLFYNLLKRMNRVTFPYRLLMLLNDLKLPLSWMRNLYHRLRYS